MKDINIKRISLLDVADEIATRSQSQAQYNNIYVALYRVTSDAANLHAGDVIYRESDADTRDFLLDASEAADALANPDDFLQSCAHSWAANDDDPVLERYRWGIGDPADAAVSSEYNQPCRIVVKGCYYGYTPYDCATDERGETLIFDNAAAAQAWIDEQESGRYYLDHNEAGRPTYYIIAA